MRVEPPGGSPETKDRTEEWRPVDMVDIMKRIVMLPKKQRRGMVSMISFISIFV